MSNIIKTISLLIVLSFGGIIDINQDFPYEIHTNTDSTFPLCIKIGKCPGPLFDITIEIAGQRLSEKYESDLVVAFGTNEKYFAAVNAFDDGFNIANKNGHLFVVPKKNEPLFETDHLLNQYSTSPKNPRHTLLVPIERDNNIAKTKWDIVGDTKSNFNHGSHLTIRIKGDRYDDKTDVIFNKHYSTLSTSFTSTWDEYSSLYMCFDVDMHEYESIIINNIIVTDNKENCDGEPITTTKPIETKDGCDNCNEERPCLHDNTGDNSCLPAIPFGSCWPGSSPCDIDKYNLGKCDKCNNKLPCWHITGKYCIPTIEMGGCNPGSVPCDGFSLGKCQMCNETRPCWNYASNKCDALVYDHSGSPICPGTTEICNGYEYLLKEKPPSNGCDKCTSYYPCLHNDGYCIESIEHGSCFPGSQPCPGYPLGKCEMCTSERPCWHQAGTHCIEKENGICPGTTEICPGYHESPQPPPSNGECNQCTSYYPCLHNDGYCVESIEHGSCFPGSLPCPGYPLGKCEMCTSERPCWHQAGTYCIKKEDGICPGTTQMCPNGYGAVSNGGQLLSEFEKDIQTQMTGIRNEITIAIAVFGIGMFIMFVLLYCTYKPYQKGFTRINTENIDVK